MDFRRKQQPLIKPEYYYVKTCSHEVSVQSTSDFKHGYPRWETYAFFIQVIAMDQLRFLYVITVEALRGKWKAVFIMDWFSRNWLVAPVSKRQQAGEVRRPIGNTDCRKNSLCDTEFTGKTCLKYIRQRKSLKLVFPVRKKVGSFLMSEVHWTNTLHSFFS